MLNKNPVRDLILLVTLVLLLLSCRLVTSQLQDTSLLCGQPYRLDTAIGVSGKSIRAEIADNDKTRQRGLSGRACIPDDVGMIFNFSRPGIYGFWMKDMRFAIDLIWISSDQKVVTIAPGVQPDSYPKVFRNTSPASYVLEIKAGQSQARGIKLGSQLNF